MSREEDYRVAQILDWIWESPTYVGEINKPDTPFWHSADDDRCEDGLCPRFTTNASDDYKVLEWARNNYRYSRLEEPLLEIYTQRASTLEARSDLGEHLKMYQPGDYSRALLELDRKGLLK